ncbi:MAG TPA: FAD-dependent oxidoreductase [Candidatus Angelobacter sp.]|nr:FAD-dependent oxidoreductase [Candidatus Angelobacter sp.]
MKTVFVIGAGPAGMFAAQKIAQGGHEVIIFNRDIKPGGLAEYGIYPTKDKMKVGLRKQFAKVLSLPNVHYFGHVPVSAESAVSIDDLRRFSPAAMVFSVGAQGTKKLGLPGETARGVYPAKDFVYYYNLLPPFTAKDFSVGKRVAVVGMGNVMVDVAHWLLVDDPKKTTEEVIVVARRGPFEAKFDKKEFKDIEEFLDRAAFDAELQRIQPQLAAVGQDPNKLAEETFPVLAKPAQEVQGGRLRFRFLCSPQAIHAGADGRISRLTVVENVLQQRDDNIACKATDKTADLEVDTMIFAIGDVADPAVGLPYNRDSYVTNPAVGEDTKGAPHYELFDPQTGKVLPGMYAVGWARKASEGLVGIARHDGEVGAAHVLKYLEGVSDGQGACAQQVRQHLESKGVRVVDKSDLESLGHAEEKIAQERGLTWFKFDKDEDMLAAIDANKAKTVSV